MRKIIVLDLDGTLLNSESKVSTESKKYLQQLKDNGHIIVIATGRNLASALKATDGAIFINYVVGNNGAFIYDLVNKKIIFKEIIESELVESLCSLYNDDFSYIHLNDLDNYYKYPNKDLDIFNIDVIQLTMCFKNGKQVDNINKYINDNYDSLYSFVMQDSFSSGKWLDITKKGCSKYNCVKVIADKEKIKNKDIIAFGDGPNDIEMLSKSGVGVAMGNAFDKVKKISNHVTLSHNEDGVIYFLKKYLK